jgi:hypothetical protein
VVEGNLGELSLRGLVDNTAPETRSSEDVGLVDRVNGEGRVREVGEVTGHAGDALNLTNGVGAGVESDGVLTLSSANDSLATVTEVNTADQLANDDDGGTLGDVLLEGRVSDEGGSREEGGTDVGVETKRLAELEETDLGTESRVSSPLGSTDGTCEYRGIVGQS